MTLANRIKMASCCFSKEKQPYVVTILEGYYY